MISHNFKIGIKLLISVMLFVAIINGLPYGYYQLLRIILPILFIILSIHHYKIEKTTPVIMCGVLAVLFQPIYKITFSAHDWHTIDLLIGSGVLLWALVDLYDGEAKKI